MHDGKLTVWVQDWALGMSDNRGQPGGLFAPGLWQLCEVTMGVKHLLSVQQGPPGPSGLPGGNGFRGPPVSFSHCLILIY